MLPQMWLCLRNGRRRECCSEWSTGWHLCQPTGKHTGSQATSNREYSQTEDGDRHSVPTTRIHVTAPAVQELHREEAPKCKRNHGAAAPNISERLSNLHTAVHLVSGFPAPNSLPSGHCLAGCPSEGEKACLLGTAWQDSPREGAMGAEPWEAALLLSHPGLGQAESNEEAVQLTSRVRE